MVQTSVQLTFPCPSCGHLLNLDGFSASGPCPTCGVPITVTLSVTAGSTAQLPEQPAQLITPLGDDGTPLLKYDERRFRPVLRLPTEVEQSEG